MSRIAYVNGRYLDQRLAEVNIEDRGYQFGDGVYEVVHLYQGRFVDAALHLDRLDRSLREMRLPSPMPRAALLHVLAEVARRNRVTEGLLYMQVTRGVAPREHAFPKRPVPPALVVTVKRIPPFPTDLDRWGASAITHPDLRWARCDIKTVNLLPNCLARQAAREAGAIEAILYEAATGLVTEGAATSFWIVDEAGTIRTRPLSHAILPGCTRAALMAELAEAGIGFEERAFSLEEMRQAREAFLTSATSFVRPITRIDGAPVGDGQVGPVVRKLFAIFARHVQGERRNAA
ncbi:D-amino-acid transaminase [Siccirubricoccus sp. KC 17139]|uniref:Probable branched-chain-amino-acid aminotransferase n=1 Tax=Siccirubricoccus soli TaxID=2899147 RepID=A0ABT1D2U2_9PROT|nr:D-amino-acid transaminase [Siccirubricoccus soli]MCO6416240.1 D-amino-acid transaminase [Siccirubricoccus soli]MCP2682374.1 D-amino-acid transaminase [Siccirubricoccus soli]